LNIGPKWGTEQLKKLQKKTITEQGGKNRNPESKTLKRAKKTGHTSMHLGGPRGLKSRSEGKKSCQGVVQKEGGGSEGLIQPRQKKRKAERGVTNQYKKKTGVCLLWNRGDHEKKRKARRGGSYKKKRTGSKKKK